MQEPKQPAPEPAKPAGPPRRRYRAVYKPLLPPEFVLQFPAFNVAVLDRQKRPVFTTETVVCPELGRAPESREECAEHDHSLAEDAIDHVKALIALASDSRLPLESACIIVPVTQRRSPFFSLKMYAPPQHWIGALRNMGIVFDVTAETRGTLENEWQYSSVVAEARKLLELCRSSGAVAAKLGMMDFLRAPDASCSSLLLFADPLSETPQLPMPLLLSDKETFDFQLMARMSATRMECTTAWSVGFFFFDGSSMYGGVKIDEGVFQRLFGVGVAPPPQLLSRDDAEKKQKLRWAKEDRVRFDPTVKMTLVYENVRREVSASTATKKCSFFFEKGFCKNGRACRFSHTK